MKRVVVLFLLVVLATALLPGLVWAQEAPVPVTTAATATAAATSALVTLPEAPPLASAQEAKDSTEWSRQGDGLNLIVALLSLAAIGGIVVWGIVAQRRIAGA